MAQIEVESLTKVFNGFRALDGISLVVERGEIFGFLGPNGAGKTTTINCCLGLIKPTSGSVRIAGMDVEEKPVEVKEICGYLPENYGFYPNLTARQNLLYFSEFYANPKDNVDELLALVGLQDSADKKVGEFSRGMKQRLALAQALINDPEVVFLDEPTNGLDPQGIADFRKIIRELNQKGKTFFFSSHILSEVREVCSVVGIINRGRIVKVGKISELSGSMEVVVQTEPRADESLLREFGEVEYDESRDVYVIKVESDCRVEISRTLFEHGFVVKELSLREPSLEKIYLSMVGE